MLLTILSPLLFASVVSSWKAVVNTSLGPIEGTAHVPILGICASFYGVPYAAAPTGANRFRPPQPASPWKETRQAFKVGKSCLQTFGDSFVNVPLAVERFLENHHIGMEPMDEDCLFLNIFTPKVQEVAQGQGLPVMVWFHGGSYMGGSGDKQSNIPFYDGHQMCKTGDVVVVTVNYRLGLFGFFATDELLQEGGTAGNMGIQDQRSALQFVQANAHRFGGDASRVTIFGESAGAGSVVNHLISPRSAPLFAAGIMQSGGLWLTSLKESISKSSAVVSATGCDPGKPGVLSCMREKDAKTLLYAMQAQKWSSTGPCADGFEQPVGFTQSAILASGNFTPKPMIVGTNRNESALFECTAEPSNMDELGFRKRLAADFHINATGSQMDRLVSLYNASSYDGLWKRAYIDVGTDREFYCGSRKVLEATAKKGQAAFQYVLERTLYFFDYYPCLGVPHMTDLFFLWGNFDVILKQEERDLGLRMRKHWTEFAHSHTPGQDWPAYGNNQQFLAFDTPADASNQQWKTKQCEALEALAGPFADDPSPIPGGLSPIHSTASNDNILDNVLV